MVLHTHTDQPLDLMSSMEVEMKYKSQQAQLPLLVVVEKGPSLLGQNRLHHIELEESSKNYVVINTRKGLFRYIMSPIWSGLCPRYISKDHGESDKGMNHVVVYIDDILVKGESKEAHSANLQEVFYKLEKA